MYISLFYYSCFWGPVPERTIRANPGLKFYFAIFFYKFNYHTVLLLKDLRVKAQQYILCSQYFVLGKRRRLKICLILGLNSIINLRRTVPSILTYSHALKRAWEYSLLISILLLLPHILAPCRSPYRLYSLESSLYSHISLCLSTYTLYSLVSSLFSHISPCLLHIPSTPLYRLCAPIYSGALYICPLHSCIVPVLL